MRLMPRGIALLSATVMLLTGCGTVEVQEVLQITDVQTGWYDAGLMEDGRNRLLPSISLRLENVSDETVSRIQLNAVFHRVIESDEPPLGDHFVQAISSEGLAPGAVGEPLVLRSGFGYTGTESRQQMLQNRMFVDARVEVYAKSGSRPWMLIGEYSIDRQLLTEQPLEAQANVRPRARVHQTIVAES